MGAKPPDPLASCYGGVAPKLPMAEPTLAKLIIRLLLFFRPIVLMRDIQNSNFVEALNCLTAFESNVLVVMTVRTVLKVPFEKAAPLALPTFRHP